MSCAVTVSIMCWLTYIPQQGESHRWFQEEKGEKGDGVINSFSCPTFPTTYKSGGWDLVHDRATPMALSLLKIHYANLLKVVATDSCCENLHESRSSQHWSSHCWSSCKYLEKSTLSPSGLFHDTLIRYTANARNFLIEAFTDSPLYLGCSWFKCSTRSCCSRLVCWFLGPTFWVRISYLIHFSTVVSEHSFATDN